MIDIVREQSYPTPYANSPLLPLLLLSLATQRHTPITKSKVKDEYDYIVVGAGAAGSVVASRLSDMECVNVLLLEAGGDPPLLTEVPATLRCFIGTDVDWGFFTEPQKCSMAGHVNRRARFPLGMMVGGTSVLQGRLSQRGNPAIYDDWAAKGAEGWSYRDLFPYFIKMEDNTNYKFVASGYHGIGGPITISDKRYYNILYKAIEEAIIGLGYDVVDSDGPSQTGFTIQQASIRNGQSCSTAKGYLVPSENRPNLDILKNAKVTKVLIQDRRAIGVQFEDCEGNEYIVNARKEVILSAGSINTPKLLMLSGIGPAEELLRHKIPVIADLNVGHNLQDQAATALFYDVSSIIEEPYEVSVASLQNIQTYIRNRTGPITLPEGCLTTAHLNKQQDPCDLPDSVVYGFYPSEIYFRALLLWNPELVDQLISPYKGRASISCVSEVLSPKSRGFVTLHSAHPDDPPIIDPKYFENFKDVDTVVGAMKNCRRIFESYPMQKLGVEPFQTVYRGCEEFVGDEDLYFTCIARTAIVPLTHPVGTAKMGNPSDPTTVVDPELKVNTIENLRVVDASVMPTTAGSNTMVTTIAIAEKAADMIKKTITCSPPIWY